MNLPQSLNNHLRDSTLFHGVEEALYPEVVGCASESKLKPKTILFHESDPADKCYLVIKGRLKLFKLNEQGKEVIIRYIGPGDLTAAVVVIKGGSYPVTAETLDETTVIAWDKRTMLQLMRKNPDIALNMIGIILERLDEVQHRYLELSTEQVGQRIARSLLRLMKRAGKKTDQGVLIDLPLSRQNVADYAGTTLYTASRMLSTWEKNGWITSKREQITITDPHALVEFSEK